MLLFHHSLQYWSRSALLQQTQKVLGLLPSFPRFCVRLGFLLLPADANGDLYHCNLSLASVSHRRPGDLFWAFQLHGIFSGLYFKQNYLYVFCSLRFQVPTGAVAPLVALTDQARDRKQGLRFLRPLPHSFPAL